MYLLLSFLFKEVYATHQKEASIGMPLGDTKKSDCWVKAAVRLWIQTSDPQLAWGVIFLKGLWQHFIQMQRRCLEAHSHPSCWVAAEDCKYLCRSYRLPIRTATYAGGIIPVPTRMVERSSLINLIRIDVSLLFWLPRLFQFSLVTTTYKRGGDVIDLKKKNPGSEG